MKVKMLVHRSGVFGEDIPGAIIEVDAAEGLRMIAKRQCVEYVEPVEEKPVEVKAEEKEVKPVKKVKDEDKA